MFRLLYCTAALFCACTFFAQTPSVSVPGFACPNQSVTAAISTTWAAPAFYQWQISPPSPTSALNVNNSQIGITWTGCGTRTVTCTGYDVNGNPIPSASATTTLQIGCPGPTVTTLAQATTVCLGYSTAISAFASGNATYTWLPGGSNQSTLSVGPGTYTLISSSVNFNCPSVNTITIAQSQPLSMMAIANPGTGCLISNSPKLGLPINLTATGAANYTWTPYNPADMTQPFGSMTVVRPQTSTCYTATGTTAICSGQAVVCVTVNPQYSITAGPMSSTVCPGNILNLSASASTQPPPSYMWTAKPEETPWLSSLSGSVVSVLPQGSTVFTVEAFTSSGCVSFPQTLSVTLAACTGLEEELSGNNLPRAFPNPASDVLFVENEGSEPYELHLFSVEGRELPMEKAAVQASAIDVSTLPSGIYFLRIGSNREIHTVIFRKE